MHLRLRGLANLLCTCKGVTLHMTTCTYTFTSYVERSWSGNETCKCHLSARGGGGGVGGGLSGGSRILERGFFYSLPKVAAQRRVVLISPREARKIFSPLFFSYQGGLSWHLRALHSKFQM